MTAASMPVPGLGPSDFPAMCIAAEVQSAQSQRKYLLLMRTQIALPLLGIAIAAIAHVGHHLAVLGIVAAGSAALLAVVRAIQRSTKIETVWYESRLSAEELKSLAWRYAVKGAPFDGDDGTTEQADERFVAELAKIAESEELLAPPDPSGEITAAMRALRTADEPSVRREAYLRDRVNNQLDWYRDRSLRYAAIGDRWDVVFFLLTAGAVVAGVVLATESSWIDWLAPAVGLTAGSTGAVIAWVGVRRYTSLHRSYRAVATQLSLIAALADEKDTPEEWAAFVDDVEQTLAREQMEWRAARR